VPAHYYISRGALAPGCWFLCGGHLQEPAGLSVMLIAVIGARVTENPITRRAREEAECIRFAGTGCRGVVVVTGRFPRRGLAVGPLSPGPSPP
jgi:hypothetical protein